MVWANIILLAAGNLFFVWLGLAAWREKSGRACRLSVLGLLVNSALWLTFLLGSPQFTVIHGANILLVSLTAVFLVVSLVSRFPNRESPDTAGIQRFDERDHMFARNNTWRHPEMANRYYASHPDKRDVDARILNRPQLGEPGGRFYHEWQTPAAEIAFDLLDRSRPLACGNVAENRKPLSSQEMSRRLMQLGRLYGAVDIGFAHLQDHHFYSHAGRQLAGWGRSIDSRHRTAVVVVVAMDYLRMQEAPAAPVMVESSRQYVESAKIAYLLAAYIRSFGYDARAHVDGNYEVLCVPLAQAAGLGRVGRMSLFMHRVYGPCVRLAVVTTDLELPATEGDYAYMEHFCDICRKCADNCPSQAIPAGEMPLSRGFRHWSVEQEACYGFWRSAGTDCAVCVRACPFTKPDTLIHRLVRWYIARNRLNQRLALLADDLFYGRRLKLPRANPEGW
ncbi:MAG: 4Fe-4S dicluster domain-containing protein [Acidobacteria bacterium]|nr:4Fe-4S dicluster domain-containing protein [Acidobacteriota bacterium]